MQIPIVSKKLAKSFCPYNEMQQEARISLWCRLDAGTLHHVFYNVRFTSSLSIRAFDVLYLLSLNWLWNWH